MARQSARSHGERGQMIVLFVLASTVILLAVGLVIDGGNALAQRRESQNASDFAALAGARVVAEWVAGDTSNGTDANVQAAIVNSLNANGATPVTFGSPNGPIYITKTGSANGFVGTITGGAIPTGTVGVSVASSRSFTPFFLGVIGVGNWTASTVATAKGGYSLAGPPGDVFPVGVSQATYDTFPLCSGDVGSSAVCEPLHLTPGSLNIPGGFGWLKFGAAGKCTGFGLGMTNDGCDNSMPFLQSQIGPTTTNPNLLPNSHGCCDAVAPEPPAVAPANRIGSLPGNKGSRRLQLLHRQRRHRDSPGLGRGGQPRRQRLVPHRWLRWVPAHRVQRRQERRGCPAPVDLARADHDGPPTQGHIARSAVGPLTLDQGQRGLPLMRSP